MIPNAQVFWTRKIACWNAIYRIQDIIDGRKLGYPSRQKYIEATIRLQHAIDRWHKAYLCAMRLGRND